MSRKRTERREGGGRRRREGARCRLGNLDLEGEVMNANWACGDEGSQEGEVEI
jgi:hypothetical protein